MLSSLRQLDLSENQLGPLSVEPLGKLLVDAPLEMLRMKNCCTGAQAPAR